VFEFGSIFGGTGAAGIPTFPKRLRAQEDVHADNLVIGAALLLPYFNFIPDRELKHELYARPETFGLNTREALRYYGRCLDVFNRVYALGAPLQRQERKFSIGGSKQCNPAHWVELVAGLSFVDFLQTPPKASPSACFTAQENEESFTWNDVPNRNEVRPLLSTMLRYCIAYRTVFRPVLSSAQTQSSETSRVPWLVDFFVRAGIDPRSQITADALVAMDKYLERFAEWIGEMHDDQPGTARLADVVPLTSPGLSAATEAGFPHVCLGVEPNPVTINEVWRRMCNAGPSSDQTGGVGRFFNVLHASCA
jgi:hypothetical protein